MSKENLVYVAVAEIAEMAKVTPQAACNWSFRHKDFPKPVASLAMGRIYLEREVAAWLKAKGKIK